MIVLWRITTVCNLACGFCAYDRRVVQPRRQVDADEVERVATLLGRYQVTSGEPVMLSWLGGEPLLWPGVLALSRPLRQQHGLRLSVTTNGTTLRRAGMVEALAEAFDEITVSIDAPDAVHERLRGWPGGMSQLADGIRRLARLRDAGAALTLRANVVLMQDTLPSFEALCARLADWGVEQITFNQLGGRDRPEFHRQQALAPADVDRLRAAMPALVAALKARGVRLHAQDGYLARLEASARGQALAVHDCESRRPTLFIDEHARIAPCSFTVDDFGLPTRALRSVADVAALRSRLAAHRRAAPAAVCGDCPSTQVFSKFGACA